jgi:hypothetical protein
MSHFCSAFSFTAGSHVSAARHSAHSWKVGEDEFAESFTAQLVECGLRFAYHGNVVD